VSGCRPFTASSRHPGRQHQLPAAASAPRDWRTRPVGSGRQAAGCLF